MRDRPGRLVFVAGTNTEVGKTWVGAALLTELRARGLSVAARKPVQSFAPGAGPTDADVLAGASVESRRAVCTDHRSYAIALAPPMAAQALGEAPFTIAEIAAEMRWDSATDIGLVEGVGGLRSPLASDGDTLDLLRALHPDAVVLVTDAELGAINAVRLSVAALEPYEPVIMMNRYDGNTDLHRRNLEWLTGGDGFQVVASIAALADRLADA